MLDDRGSAGVFDYKAIRKNLRVPYPFEPYEPRPARACKYRETGSYLGCGCLNAGPGGTTLTCKAWSGMDAKGEPLVVQVEAPEKLPAGRH